MKPLQVLLALFAFAFLPLHAASLDDLTYTTNNAEVTITDCDTAATGELVIPDIIGGNPVTSIGERAFVDCTSLTSITIGNGVTSIGDFAFFSCTGLTSITIGNGVTSIGDYAFGACSSLTSITIPDSVTAISGAAFAGCSSLTGITIPDGVTSIGGLAFAGCSSLTGITIPDGVTSIGDYAFVECTSLTSITIGNGVTSIGDFAFFSCTSLTSITFQGVAPTVGASAFSGVSDGAVALVVGSTSFGESGADWNGLTVARLLTWSTTFEKVTITDCDTDATGELIIPDTIKGNPVTSIGNDAFRKCRSLTSVTIPGSVTSIGYTAFRDCTSLTSMTIPDRVKSIGFEAFRDCTSLTSMTIPDSVNSIGGLAFQGCISLTSITIPNGVTSIGEAAFDQCTGLTNITIPDSVTSIGNYAFGACSSLTSISIPDSVTSIGNYAFQDCPASIEIRPATQNSLAAQLAAVTAERDAAITERDTRPTQAAYDAAVGTARTAGQGDVTGDPASYSLFTEDQINAMTVDPTVGRNAAGNMQVDISFIHSTDLQTFTPFAVNPAWVSVVDGKIALEFPPSDENTFFYRLGVQ